MCVSRSVSALVSMSLSRLGLSLSLSLSLPPSLSLCPCLFWAYLCPCPCHWLCLWLCLCLRLYLPHHVTTEVCLTLQSSAGAPSLLAPTGMPKTRSISPSHCSLATCAFMRTPTTIGPRGVLAFFCARKTARANSSTTSW